MLISKSKVNLFWAYSSLLLLTVNYRFGLFTLLKLIHADFTLLLLYLCLLYGVGHFLLRTVSKKTTPYGRGIPSRGAGTSSDHVGTYWYGVVCSTPTKGVRRSRLVTHSAR